MSGYNYSDNRYPDRRYDSSRGHSRGGYRGNRDHYRGSYYRGRGRGYSSGRARDFRRDYGERDPRDRDPRDRDPRELDPRDRDPREYREYRNRDEYQNDYKERDYRDREPSYGRDSRYEKPPSREYRDNRDRDGRDSRDVRDNRDFRDHRDSRDGQFSDYRGDRPDRRNEFVKEPSRSKSIGTPKHDNSSPRHTPSSFSGASSSGPAPSRDPGPVSSPSAATPSYTDPWISILHIRDSKVASRLEARHQELANVNRSLGQLQAQRHKLKAHMDLLDVYAKRDALNVELTSEKLDEFTFL
ncbi:hypothetical protein FT663_02567 [Candidozyma haemuli var. vulneris]|uniref:Transcription regulator LGE1 helical region domain-containing protein n=1 Tax=Candidozyma haemuli TaxID=45357 RepID=A0A2V1AZX2_9ASCO|nr:hypothetical protein CXQ85_005010 [[Candida] haemuloni]KAF3986902.1 hypothetical protein FT662_04314 [[Candida] haemuloni var. vulneris]KAF3991816.1 hypothetical protein FT663_02567 [[Candida] haemuloni var. vulneris]PVH22441.1 hypothetical protein CXQ85_005010 [[Candida] haemuloni]